MEKHRLKGGNMAKEGESEVRCDCCGEALIRNEALWIDRLKKKVCSFACATRLLEHEGGQEPFERIYLFKVPEFNHAR